MVISISGKPYESILSFWTTFTCIRSLSRAVDGHMYLETRRLFVTNTRFRIVRDSHVRYGRINWRGRVSRSHGHTTGAILKEVARKFAILTENRAKVRRFSAGLPSRPDSVPKKSIVSTNTALESVPIVAAAVPKNPRIGLCNCSCNSADMRSYIYRKATIIHTIYLVGSHISHLHTSGGIGWGALRNSQSLL